MEQKNKVKVIELSDFPKFQLEIRNRTNLTNDQDYQHVKSIISEVKQKGDNAVIEFTKKFDKVELNDGITVRKEDIKRSYENVKDNQIEAIKKLKMKVEKLEKIKLKTLSYNYHDEIDQIKIKNVIRPLPSVGCYVPGGRASYPSTLLMTTVPAKVARIPRIVVCTPPMSTGEVNPITLIAADIVGIDEIYRIGGVQAIAAMAYGTESVEPVSKIVGPGNKFVTLAKAIISQNVPIDMPAGPSEIIILADETAESNMIARDLISQSEHGPDNISILITTSERLAKEVASKLDNLFHTLPRKEIVSKAFSENGYILICDNYDYAINFINDYAPEHLEIMTEKDSEIAEKIWSAGIILLGPNTPVSASDYSIGTNHVLPSAGFGKNYSGLSVLDFVKRINIVQSSKNGLNMMRDTIRTLAECEGLPNHYLAVEERFDD